MLDFDETTNQYNINIKDDLLERGGEYILIDKERNEDIRKDLHVTDVITRIKYYKINFGNMLIG
jgi:hypothetical protein